MRDWMVDAALAPVVPIGKVLSRVAGPMMKRTSRGIIKYNGDMNELKRNPTPFKRGSGKKNKEKSPKANPAFTIDEAQQMLNSNISPSASIPLNPPQVYLQQTSMPMLQPTPQPIPQ